MTLDTLLADAFHDASLAIEGEVVDRLVAAVRKREPSYASRLRTVPQLSEETPFSEGYLYQLARNAEVNGLAKLKAVVKLDRMVFVHVDRFGEWVAQREVK